MQRHLRSVMTVLSMLPALFAMNAARSEAVTLEVLSPRGEIEPPPVHAPQPRVSDLDGKRVGIYWVGKAGGNNFWDGVAELLRSRYPSAELVRYQGSRDLGDERAAELAGEVDTLFYGVGD